MSKEYNASHLSSSAQPKNTHIDNLMREGFPMPKNQKRTVMYSWAEQLFYTDIISASVMHTLKAIISCLSLEQPTIEQINSARTRSASRKFAQDDIVSNRTIRRHIKILEMLKFIEVDRDHKAWDNRNSYTINVSAEYLVDQRGDMVSSSISCSQGSSISKYPNLYEKDFEIKQTNNETMNALEEYEQLRVQIKQKNNSGAIKMIKSKEPKSMADSMADALKPKREINPVFLNLIDRKIRDLNPDQLAILDKFTKLGIYKNLALQWINKYTCAQLSNLIEASQLYGAEKPWAYIKASIENLRLEQEIKPYVPPICYKPWEPGAKMSKSITEVGLAKIREIKARMQK